MDKKKVIARIEQLRIEKGISVYQLKENADISSTIYQWKKNATRDRNRTPSLRSIEKICDYLGVSLSYFFAFDEDTQTDVKNKELTEAIKKLNKEEYVLLSTGEVFNCEHIENRGQNINTVRQSVTRLRNLINNNFTGGKNELWITLTFGKNKVYNANELYLSLIHI